MNELIKKMMPEFEEILYKLFSHDELITAEISSFLDAYSVPYMSGINFAQRLTDEQWTELESITDDGKWKSIYLKNADVPTDDGEEDEIEIFEEESIVSFICGIHKVGRDLGRYPR